VFKETQVFVTAPNINVKEEIKFNFIENGGTYKYFIVFKFTPLFLKYVSIECQILMCPWELEHRSGG
jgi:hypothetical protein